MYVNVQMYNFIWTCFVVMPYFWVRGLTSKSSRFSKVSTDGNAYVLATYRHVRSALQCAAICNRLRMDDGRPMCQAYSFDQTLRKCKTYSYRTGIRMTRTPGNEVYMKRPYCDTTDGFNDVKWANYHFCYLLEGDRKNASSAAERCASLGAYLIHFDSVTETMVTKSYAAQKNHAYSWLWAGANDEHGHWVTNKDGAPMDTRIWQWNLGEPNGYNFENCIMFDANSHTFIDHSCNMTYPYICERTVIK